MRGERGADRLGDGLITSISGREWQLTGTAEDRKLRRTCVSMSILLSPQRSPSYGQR